MITFVFYVLIISLVVFVIFGFNQKDSFRDILEFVPNYYLFLIDSNNKLLFKKNESWKKALPSDLRLKSISQTKIGIWGTTTNNDIVYALRQEDAASGNWRRVNGYGNMICASHSGDDIWLIAPDKKLYHRTRVDEYWRYMNTEADHISVGANGLNIWIIKNNKIYYAHDIEHVIYKDWTLFPGIMDQIEVSSYGDLVVGLWHNKFFFRWINPTCISTPWTHAKLPSFKRIGFTHRLWGEIYGIKTNGTLVFLNFNGKKWIVSNKKMFI